MNPELIDNMSWEMAEVYGAITDQILINLAHYFPYFKPGQPVPVSSFEYQANMLAQMGQVNKDTIKIIRNGLSGADEALKGSLEQAIIEAVSKAQPELLEGIKKGILAPAGKPILSPSLSRAFSLYYQQAADKLNLVNTVMLESTQSAYQQCVSDVVAEIGLADSMNRLQIALDTAAGETVTGVSAWNQALKHATDRMKETGIVGFIDHAGHRWSAEAYTAMDIRTTVANTARAATWETNQDFGNDLYQVSYHNGARPLCYPWQSKVISSLDAARTVIDLDGNEITVYAQSSTTYGQAAGLFGINCKHYPTPFIPGVSLVREGAQGEADNAKSYKESQQQRGLERKIREQKRDLLMLKEQGAPKEMLKAQREKIRKTDDEIDAFCDMTGRARRQNREAVYTKRDFPSSKTYDVSQFERKQKDIIDNFFGGGGAQQGYTAGQMTPDEPVKYDFGGKEATITEKGQTIIKDTLSSLQKQYPIPEGYKLDVMDFRSRRGFSYSEDLEELLDRLDVEENENYFGTKARFVPMSGKRLLIEYVDTTMPDYTPKEKVFEQINAILKRNPDGKPFNAGWGYECDTIHEYGHLLASVYKFYGSNDPEFVAWFNTLDKELIKKQISVYAATNWNEFFAESFLQSFSPYQSDLSKQAMEYLRKKMGGS